MGDYKFKVGDRVRILKMDGWSNEGMSESFGRVGVVIEREDETKVNGYGVKFLDESSYVVFWYMEDSLELVKLEKEDNNYKEETVNKDDVLSILYEIKENRIISYETICDLIRRVSDLPCK